MFNIARFKNVNKGYVSLKRTIYSTQNRFFGNHYIEDRDYVIIGGGPVGASASCFLGNKFSELGIKQSITMIRDSKKPGAHEDYSRLSRLSMDGSFEEYNLSKYATELIDLVDEMQSYNSGAPVIPIKSGILFVASEGTIMHQRCSMGEMFGDDQYMKIPASSLETFYAENKFSLPMKTSCWSHPIGYSIDPMQMSICLQKSAAAYGIETIDGYAKIDMDEEGYFRISVCKENDISSCYRTKHCLLFGGARNKQILEESVNRDPKMNADLLIHEFNNTYITSISTIRYNHVDLPPPTIPPIILGQLNIPELLSFQANFSIVPEQNGNVYKVRLSGDIGSEVIPNVESKLEVQQNDIEMQSMYHRVFGNLFPFLNTEKPLDFNRCVTYRNKDRKFTGTSLLKKEIGDAKLITTVACNGVGVKFGPILGEAVVKELTQYEEQLPGVEIFHAAKDCVKLITDDDSERAW